MGQRGTVRAWDCDSFTGKELKVFSLEQAFLYTVE